MGNIRRIRKSLAKVAIIDTHVSINGCQVLLGHPNPDKAAVSAKGFKEMLTRALVRSQSVNVGDLYNASLFLRERYENGEALWN